MHNTLVYEHLFLGCPRIYLRLKSRGFLKILGINKLFKQNSPIFNMEIETIFLGTSTAVPTAKRSHPAILISFQNENILIDCGEGTQRQFKKAKINFCKLTRILITHWHADHTLGLTGLLETMAMSEYSKTLHIYGPKGTKSKIDCLEKIYGKFKIDLKIHEISGKFLDEKEFFLEASAMSHNIPTNAYSINIKEKIRLDKKKLKKLKLPNSPLLGKLQPGKNIKHNGKTIKASSVSYSEPGKKITIILDTSFNKKTITLAKNSDLLISEASFLDKDSKRANLYKHLTAKQAATIAKKSKSSKLALIHISRRYEAFLDQIEKEAKATFKHVLMPNDLDKISI